MPIKPLSRFLNFKLLALFLGGVFVASYALADDVVAPQDFLAQVLAAIKAFGGLSAMMKISAVITLVIASMKVSFMKPLWDKLGAAKVYVAPLLGLIGGILGLGVSGPISLPSVFAYTTAGAGAVFLHEILDSLKSLPGIGGIYLTIIQLVQGALGGKPKA